MKRTSAPIQEVHVESSNSVATLAELASMYKQSQYWLELSDKTKTSYDQYIWELVKSPYGKKHPDAITPLVAERIYQSIVSQGYRAKANHFVWAWSAVYTFGQRFEFIKVNPWSLVRTKACDPRRVFWSHDEVLKVIATAKTMGYKEVAICVALLYDTAQRLGDVLKMTYADVKKDEEGYYVEVKQNKTDTEVRPPLGELSTSLLDSRLLGECDQRAGGMAEEKANGVRLVGGNYTPQGMYYRFSRVLEASQVRQELRMQDLRRTALTEMGQAGASDDLMIATSGHKARNMLNVYSVSTRRKALEAQRLRNAGRLHTGTGTETKRDEADGLPAVLGP